MTVDWDEDVAAARSTLMRELGTAIPCSIEQLAERVCQQSAEFRRLLKSAQQGPITDGTLVAEQEKHKAEIEDLMRRLIKDRGRHEEKMEKASRIIEKYHQAEVDAVDVLDRAGVPATDGEDVAYSLAHRIAYLNASKQVDGLRKQLFAETGIGVELRKQLADERTAHSSLIEERKQEQELFRERIKDLGALANALETERAAACRELHEPGTCRDLPAAIRRIVRPEEGQPLASAQSEGIPHQLLDPSCLPSSYLHDCALYAIEEARELLEAARKCGEEEEGA